jgi:hypothetical protein
MMRLSTSLVFIVIISLAILILILLFQTGVFRYVANSIAGFLQVSNTTVTRSVNLINQSLPS